MNHDAAMPLPATESLERFPSDIRAMRLTFGKIPNNRLYNLDSIGERQLSSLFRASGAHGRRQIQRRHVRGALAKNSSVRSELNAELETGHRAGRAGTEPNKSRVERGKIFLIEKQSMQGRRQAGENGGAQPG